MALLVMSISTYFDPDKVYYYDNFWADISLNGGNPPLTSVYSLIDIFTWNGWIAGMGIAFMIDLIEYSYWALFLGLVFVTLYAVTDIPFCASGDYILYYVDMCDAVNYLYNSRIGWKVSS